MSNDRRRGDTGCAMPASRSEPRYVLAVGQISREVALLDEVKVLRRLGQVVLVQTSAPTAARLRREGRPHVHVYSSEEAAQTALALFQH